MLLILGTVLGLTAKVFMKPYTSRARSFMDRVSLPNIADLSLLIVRAPDDEASLSRGLMQAANRLLWLVWRVLALHWVTLLWKATLRQADRVKARTILERGAELWIIAFISSFIPLILVQNHVTQGVVLPVLVLLWAPMLVLLPTIFVAALLIIPAGIINALALLPFGPGFSIFSPFIEVSAESSPPGACRVVQLPWESQPRMGEEIATAPPDVTGLLDRALWGALEFWNQIRSSTIHLQHSKTYSDPRAIATVVKWMQDHVSDRQF